jgi:Fe-coproporphyrin III synthase
MGRAIPNPPCFSLFYYFRLLPDGLIMPCTLKPRAIGDLRKNTFTEIWQSKEAEKMRLEIKNCKGCWVECDIVSNIVYSLNTVRKIIGEMLSLKKEKN